MVCSHRNEDKRGREKKKDDLRKEVKDIKI